MLIKRMPSQLIKALIGVGLIGGLLAGTSAAQPIGNSNPLFEPQRCMIAAYLRAIYVRPSLLKERDRFVVISVEGQPQAYVQCMFAKDFTLLYCEASSGFYAKRESEPRTLYLPQNRIKALAKLGFATGPKEKNYRYERRLDRDPDFEAIATLMMTALHDGYDVRKDSRLRLQAPAVTTPIDTACRR